MYYQADSMRPSDLGGGGTFRGFRCLSRTMKLTLFRLTTLVVSTLIGLAAFSLKELVELPLMDIPPVETASDIACFFPLPYRNIVISVPGNDEFYLGKRKLVLSELCESIEQEAIYIRPGKRILFIKSAAKVRFESLYRLISQARECNIERIDFVIDKKKRGL